MSTTTTSTGPIAPDVFADGEALIEAIMAGKKPDPELIRRIHDRADKITEEIRQKHGLLDIGVPAIREFRDRERANVVILAPRDECWRVACD